MLEKSVFVKSSGREFGVCRLVGFGFLERDGGIGVLCFGGIRTVLRGSWVLILLDKIGGYRV